MNIKINPKYIVVLLVICSVMSAIYLEFTDPTASFLSGKQSLVDHYVKENTYMPEVKFVKDLIKALFNVVNA